MDPDIIIHFYAGLAIGLAIGTFLVWKSAQDEHQRLVELKEAVDRLKQRMGVD